MEEGIVADLSRLLRWLGEEGVEPLLVGGTALNLWGGQVATFDLDLALLPRAGEREKAIRVLLRRRFRVVEPPELADRGVEEAVAHMARGGQHLKFLDGLLVDLVFHLEGVDLEAAHRRGHAYRLPGGARPDRGGGRLRRPPGSAEAGGASPKKMLEGSGRAEIDVNVISFEDLHSNKRALAEQFGSPKDAVHLQQMEALLESMGEKRPVGTQWTTRLRRIRGTVHLVRVRRMKGREEVERVL